MKVLSIKCGLAYLVCAGIKDVENRTWKTEYRGKLLIHSCGTLTDQGLIFAPGSILLSDINDPVRRKKSGNFRNDENGGYSIIKKPGMEKEIEFLYRINGIMGRKKIELITQAIIGEVDLVDIIQNSKSPFAIAGQNHWILKNPVWYDKPLRQILGKERLWNFNK